MKKLFSLLFMFMAVFSMTGCELFTVNNVEFNDGTNDNNNETQSIRYMSSINLAYAAIENLELVVTSEDSAYFYTFNILQSIKNGEVYEEMQTEGSIDGVKYFYPDGDQIFMHTDHTINAYYYNYIDENTAIIHDTRLPESIQSFHDEYNLSELDLTWDPTSESSWQEVEQITDVTSAHTLEFYEGLSADSFSDNVYDELSETSTVTIDLSTQSAFEYFYNNMLSYTFGQDINVLQFVSASVVLEVDENREVVSLDLTIYYNAGQNFESERKLEITVDPKNFESANELLVKPIIPIVG